MLLSETDIAELRRSLGMTLKQFAELFGVSEATACRWENGKRRPDYDMLVQLSNMMEVHQRSANRHGRTKQPA